MWLSFSRPGRDGGFEEARACVEAGEAMAGTGDEAEDLGTRVEKVEDLGDKEETESLGEVTEDTNNGKDHAREVAVGVADENLCGVPVVEEQGAGDAYPGEEEIKGEEMGVGGRVRIRGEEVEAIVEDKEQSNDDAL